ncbi:uncharacterized protein LOC122215280 [Panthera leo]|uniref:uncharacterized protein LOC122215280 n=1 Tax=Panthera leo TaxID=9689 RepID=UPI001C69AEAE|nr:uncharacterized protein LOC122215280 [Panthera leo]
MKRHRGINSQMAQNKGKASPHQMYVASFHGEENMLVSQAAWSLGPVSGPHPRPQGAFTVPPPLLRLGTPSTLADGLMWTRSRAWASCTTCFSIWSCAVHRLHSHTQKPSPVSRQVEVVQNSTKARISGGEKMLGCLGDTGISSDEVLPVSCIRTSRSRSLHAPVTQRQWLRSSLPRPPEDRPLQGGRTYWPWTSTGAVARGARAEPGRAEASQWQHRHSGQAAQQTVQQTHCPAFGRPQWK